MYLMGQYYCLYVPTSSAVLESCLCLSDDGKESLMTLVHDTEKQCYDSNPLGHGAFPGMSFQNTLLAFPRSAYFVCAEYEPCHS